MKDIKKQNKFDIAKEMDIVEKHKAKQIEKVLYHKKNIKILEQNIKLLDRELDKLAKKF